VVDKPPVYRDVALPTAPSTEITAKGDIVYTEISRTNVRKLESYVKGESYIPNKADGRNGFWRCC
jgi:fatty acid synthase subunit alpha